MKKTVVLVHGIWLTGLEMSLLKRRLQRDGYTVRLFHYHSLLRSPEQNAYHLNQFVAKLDTDIVHFVAHSLGGIVVSHLFSSCPVQRPGRVVMIGTPLRGSSVARAFFKQPVLRWLLGRSVQNGLLGNAPRWKDTRDLAMIAGTRGLGIGMFLFGGLEQPNDGTVSVAETNAEGIRLHVQVPFSHFGMLFSAQVADLVADFLSA
ncbi:MAG: esterase/lipase family protein [Thiotrichales bacterium]